jgi:predicted DNA-binding transcriptional regulator AlpA
MPAPRLLTTEAAAEYLSLEPGTLENWRYKGTGPPVTRLGGRAVRYDIKDLDAWVDAQKGAA